MVVVERWLLDWFLRWRIVLFVRINIIIFLESVLGCIEVGIVKIFLLFEVIDFNFCWFVEFLIVIVIKWIFFFFKSLVLVIMLFVLSFDLLFVIIISIFLVLWWVMFFLNDFSVFFSVLFIVELLLSWLSVWMYVFSWVGFVRLELKFMICLVCVLNRMML